MSRILTKREHDASLRVLRALRNAAPATVLLSWDNDMQDALGRLQRAGYVETIPAYGGRAPRSSAPFRPDRIVTTPRGQTYLEQIEQTQRQGKGLSMAKKSYKYKPRRLKRREVGNERCEMVKMPNGTKHQLCVRAEKYGYSGKLHPRTGSKMPPLPVSVGRARSLKSAMSSAKQFVRRLAMKSKRGGR